jgi:hypothetical protein
MPADTHLKLITKAQNDWQAIRAGAGIAITANVMLSIT